MRNTNTRTHRQTDTSIHTGAGIVKRPFFFYGHGDAARGSPAFIFGRTAASPCPHWTNTLFYKSIFYCTGNPVSPQSNDYNNTSVKNKKNYQPAGTDTIKNF